MTSIEALDHLYWAMHAVSYRRISADVEMASNYVTFLIVVSFAVALVAAAASSGFQVSHGPPPLGNAHSIVPAHQLGHQNGLHRRCI